MATLSPDGYLQELCDAREKLDDFSRRVVVDGKTSYFKDIALKLRVIYIEKSRTQPLLKEVLAQHKLTVAVLISWSLEEKVARGLVPASRAEGLVMSVSNSMGFWFRQGDELVDPFAAIQRREVLLNGEHISLQSLIETIADKQAAHVDKTFPDKHLSLQSDQLLIGTLPVAHRVLVDGARATIQLVNRVERAVTHHEYSDFVHPI